MPIAGGLGGSRAPRFAGSEVREMVVGFLRLRRDGPDGNRVTVF